MKKISRVSAWLLAVVMLLTLIPTMVSAEELTVYPLADYADCVKLVGRTEVTDTAIVPHTTASGIAFYSNCSGTIEMSIKGMKNLFDAQYFIVYVDGVIHKRVELPHLTKNRLVTKTLVMAENLPEGMHRIEILRETEEVNAYCEFLSISLNGEMTPVAEAPMLIEFVGDSITTGYGAYPFDYADENDPVDHPSRQAGTKSYAYLTARELGMDIQVCCTSGYGAEVGWNADGVNMQDMYEKTAFHHNREAEWSFERPADIVVINLGTNDNSVRKTRYTSEAQILSGMKNLTNIVRSRNPDAKIVWATGMMGICFKKGLTEMVEELGGADAGYYFCVLPKGTSGGAGHPDEAEHLAASETLIEFLKTEVLDADYASGFVSADDMKALIEQAAGLDTFDGYVDFAKAELDSFLASETEFSGTMTAMYQLLKAQVDAYVPGEDAPDQNPSSDAPEDDAKGLTKDQIIIIAAVAIGVLALAVLAVVLVYSLKAPTSKAKDTSPNQTEQTPDEGETKEGE